VARTGTQVSAGDVVLLVRHRGGRGLEAARALLDGAISISDGPVTEPPLIVERVMHG
jgi:pyrimidine-nucleoside phosphorylase/thymidine phosphorylase